MKREGVKGRGKSVKKREKWLCQFERKGEKERNERQYKRERMGERKRERGEGVNNR